LLSLPLVDAIASAYAGREFRPPLPEIPVERA